MVGETTNTNFLNIRACYKLSIIRRLIKMAEKIGEIENFFSKINVCVLHVTKGELALNDTIMIKGSTTDITMTVDSMQIDRKDVERVKAGEKVGLKVPDRVRPGDEVFKE